MTVFSNVTVKIGGQSVDMENVGEMVLIRQLDTRGKLAVCGFVDSELRLKMRGQLSVAPGDKIEVFMDGMRFADHYTDSISRKGDVVSIRAHDLMRRTAARYEGEVSTGQHSQLFVEAMALSCGFSGARGTPLMTLYPSDINKRTVRQILMTVSEYGCGVWYCSNGNTLTFTKFGDCSDEFTLSDGALYIHSVKGSVTAVTAENKATQEIYSSGTGSRNSTLLISGAALTRERTVEIASETAGMTVRSFYAEGVGLDVPAEGLTAFASEGVRYTAYRTEIHFEGRVYANARTEDIFEDDRELQTAAELDKKLVEGRLYGAAVSDGEGFGIVEEISGDIRGSKRHGFSPVEDNVTRFDGAVLDGIMPDRVEKISDTARRIVYGGSAYRLTYSDQGGVKTDIRLTREE
ncbi:MAG: hypothetical protein IJ080_07135 [Oscillospiraceae bacterium]|nr:hypothetical protein [Oscillospiraceae bacterium]